MGRWVVLGCLIGLFWAGASWADELPVFDVTMSRGQPFVSLMSVAQAFKANLRILPSERAVYIEYGDQEASVTDGTVLTVNRQLVVLSVAPYWRGGELFVPLDAVQKIFYVTVHWRIHTRQAAFSSSRPQEPTPGPVPIEVPPRR